MRLAVPVGRPVAWSNRPVVTRVLAALGAIGARTDFLLRSVVNPAAGTKGDAR